tara:strand:+ start:371 stop:721 length:351 start_codon:yes stop_codon:yes gene_type:complete
MNAKNTNSLVTWEDHLRHAIDRMQSTIVDEIRIVKTVPVFVDHHNPESRPSNRFSAIVEADGIRFVILVTDKRFIVRPASPSPFRCVFNRHSMPPGRRYLMHQAIESIVDLMGVMA